jgi:hypothetical protein
MQKQLLPFLSSPQLGIARPQLLEVITCTQDVVRHLLLRSLMPILPVINPANAKETVQFLQFGPQAFSTFSL